MIPRYVMDTSVWIAAMRSRTGASYEFLRQARSRRFALFATPALALEYESVLFRPEHRAAIVLTGEDRTAALDELLLLLHPVTIFYSYRPQLTDPNDEHVLEAAISARAQAIVTHNTSDFLPAALRFGIQVLTPASIISLGGRP